MLTLTFILFDFYSLKFETRSWSLVKLPRVDSNFQFSGLSLTSSWDYRWLSLYLTYWLFFLKTRSHVAQTILKVVMFLRMTLDFCFSLPYRYSAVLFAYTSLPDFCDAGDQTLGFFQAEASTLARELCV